MSDYVERLHEDLEEKLKCLSWAHNEPALHVSEYFAELRRQVDLDAERLLSEVQSVKRDTGKSPKDSDVNETRQEFIRILDELEKRTGHQPKPQKPASDVYALFKLRVLMFEYSSSSLDDLDESYDKLAREITDEIGRVEKRILGEQTIIYWPHEDRNQLGSLVYFGDLYLNKLETGCLRCGKFSPENTCEHEASVCSFALPYDLNKTKQVIECIGENNFSKFGQASKFFCIGKTKEDYTGYSAEGSSLEREFVSYQNRDYIGRVIITGTVGLDTSANLFGIYSSKRCILEIENLRLKSLHVNLLPWPFTRLTRLGLIDVHFESFSTKLLAMCTSLIELKLQATFSKSVKFDLAFLRALTKLETLVLTLPDLPADFSMFRGLTHLSNLKLEGSFFCNDQLPKLSKAALEQLLSLPSLNKLELSGFDIEAIDREMLSRCSQLRTLNLGKNRIVRVTEDACWNLGFPLCFKKPKDDANRVYRHHVGICINLIQCDIRALNVENLTGMVGLTDLLLTANSITDLPPGLFQELPSLQQINLDNNRIRHIRSGVFSKLDKLLWLDLGYNPIDSIEANAFGQLDNLRELFLQNCRLKSIDSEMFNGLQSLKELHLEDNLIERIEVVTEDRCRIDVAKANLSDEEKQLVKKHLFKDLLRLEDLGLNYNKLKKLDLNCFSNLKSLQKLDLSSNKIDEFRGVVRRELLPNLLELMLDDNKLATISKRSLPKNLTYLDLSRNRLKRLKEDFFAGFTKLEVVDLSQNELTWTITQATFARCRNSLERIDLHQNESISLADEAFRGMHNLRWIEFDFNEDVFYNASFCDTLIINRKLTPEDLQSLEGINFNELKICRLFNCSIKSLKREFDWENTPTTPETDNFNLSWLVEASQLEEFHLDENLIEALDDPDLFWDFKLINMIDLSSNRLIRIHRDIFKGLSRLNTIILAGNNLSSIDMGLFRHLKRLKYLNISSNSISFLNLARLFRNCPRLERLSVADNQLDDRSTAEQIDPRTCCSLGTLELANNHLETMNFVRDMINLRHLDLRGNRIDSIMSDGENMLGRLNKLTHLNLSENRIRFLRDEMFAHLRFKLYFLDLSGNPIDFKLDSVLLELI